MGGQNPSPLLWFRSLLHAYDISTIFSYAPLLFLYISNSIRAVLHSIPDENVTMIIDCSSPYSDLGPRL